MYNLRQNMPLLFATLISTGACLLRGVERQLRWEQDRAHGVTLKQGLMYCMLIK